MQKKFSKVVASLLALGIMTSVPFSAPSVEAYAEELVIENAGTDLPVKDTAYSSVQDFETLAGGTMGTPLDGISVVNGTVALSDLYTGEGNGDAVMEITRSSDAKFEVRTNFNSADFPAVGKIVSYDWYCQDVTKQNKLMLQLKGYGDVTDQTYEMYIGANYENGELQAYYRYKNAISDSTDPNKVDVQETLSNDLIKQGWNNFVLDFSVKGEVTYIVNDVEILTIETSDGDYGGFTTAAFVDFWTTSGYKDGKVYVDNVTLTTPAQIPTAPVVDDKMDTFDFTYAGATVTPSEYEYSLDGGDNWETLEKKPLYVGNVDVAAGDVQVRAKAPAGEQFTFPVISNETAYTSTQYIDLSMEREEDFENFNSLVNVPPEGTVDPATVPPQLIVSTDMYSRSGVSSMLIIPDGENDAPDNSTSRHKGGMFRIGNESDVLIEDKVLTVWMYDTMDTDKDYKTIGIAKELDASGNMKSECMLGFNNAVATSYYVIRSRPGASSDWGSWGNTGVTRTEGWHSFQWDYTEEGYCSIYVDGKFVRKYEADGFNNYYLQDTWSHSGVDTMAYYIDDITITDSRDDVAIVPEAPTAPVVDDVNDTLGFTPVDGMADLALYEYSVNSGETFMDVTSNPIELEEDSFDVGEVMVRLKATDTTESGMVLRNDAMYTPADYFYKVSLEEAYERVCSFYEGDYTAESWGVLAPALEAAKASLDEESGYQDALVALESAVDNLEMDLADIVSYSFDNENEPNPFNIITGTPDYGQYTNISSHGGQGLMLNTEYVDGAYRTKAVYSFAEVMYDKVVTLYFRDLYSGSTVVTLTNSETGDGVKIYGSGDYRAKTIDNGIESGEITTSMRRNDDWYQLEFNFATNDGVRCYMDTRNWLNTSVIDGFDTITVEFSHSSASFSAIDELVITEKNPVTEIKLNDDSATIGYYDSYEMNINNWTLVTEKDYATTDKFTWSSTNTSIAPVTTGGSIENHGVGTAKVTATASSGVSATMDINCVDLEAESVNISISDYNDEPNYAETVTIEPGSKKVLNALIAPEGTTERDVTWETSDSSIVTVDRGEVTAVAEGTATVTVKTAESGKTDTITVVVSKDTYAYGVEYFVAKDGNDITGDGSMELPFASIERARDEIRALASMPANGAVVYIREGEYTILNGIEFEAQDQGSDEAPIKYEAYNGENVTFKGTIDLVASDMQKVTDPEIIAKLPSSAQDKVYEIDLSDYITQHKDLQYVGHSITGNLALMHDWFHELGYNDDLPYYSFTFNNEVQTLSRWPNTTETPSGSSYAGYTRINQVPNAGANPRMWQDDVISSPDWVAPEDRDYTDTFEVGSNALDARIDSWVGIPDDGTDILDMDIWMSGYWYNDFSDQSAQVRSISGDYLKSDIPSAYSTRSSLTYNRFYVYNLIQELDIPGEWYFDQMNESYTLYFYPPEGTDMTSDEITMQMSALEEAMFTFENTENITVSGVDILGVLNHGVIISGSEDIAYKNATIRATELKAGIIRDTEENITYNSGFENINFYDVNGGVHMSGGDYNNLISQGNYIQNCHFDNFATVNKSYNPAVEMTGVGNRISSTIIENGPHNAIMYQGNDHLIEFTEIFDVVLEAKDQSAIYACRNTIARGTVMRMNYIHDIPKGTGNANSGIYLDDLTSGVTIIDNVFEDMGWGIFMNGGRDNIMIDNLFHNTQDGIVINDWAYVGCDNWYVHGYGTLAEPMTMAPTYEEWSDPNSAYGKYEHLWTIRDDDKLHSKYNVSIGNVSTGTGDLMYYMSRSVQANATNVLKDWFFEKGNTY